MDSDDAFDEFIEVDPVSSDSSDNEKENKKRKHLTNEQYYMMKKFVQDNDKNLFSRRKYTEMWSNLTAKLNALGPPTHPTKVWRQKWSSYRLKDEKRVRTKAIALKHETDEIVRKSSDRIVPLTTKDDEKHTSTGTGVHLNDQFRSPSNSSSNSKEIESCQPNQCSSTSGNTDSVQDRQSIQFRTNVLKKLDEITHQQGILMEQQGVLMEQQRTMIDSQQNRDSRDSLLVQLLNEMSQVLTSNANSNRNFNVN